MSRNPFIPASSNTSSSLLIKSAMELVFGGRVSQVKFDKPLNSRLNISARVLEKQKAPYRTHLQFELGRRGELVNFSSFCNCYAYSECKHAAAVLISILQREERNKLPKAVQSWFSGIDIPEALNNQDNSVIHYHLLINELIDKKPQISLLYHKVLDAGRLSKGEELDLDAETLTVINNPIDQQIISRLKANSFNRDTLQGIEHYCLSDDILLQALLQSGRLFYGTDKKKIKLAERKIARLNWEITDNGAQVLRLLTNSLEDKIFLLDSPFYFDDKTLEIGALELPLDEKIVKTLLLSPPIPAEKIKAVGQKLKPLIGELYLPKEIEVSRVIKNITPKLHLEFKTFDLFESQKSSLACQLNGQVVAIKPSYKYKDHLAKHQEGSLARLLVMKKGELCEILRKAEQEKELFESVSKHFLLKAMNGLYQVKGSLNERQDYYLVSNEWLTRSQEDFLKDGLQKLNESEVDYSIEQLKFFEVIDAEDGQWLSSVIPSGEQFFQYELGIIFDNKKIDVLPLLLDLLKKYELSELSNLDDELPLTLNVDKHTKLKVTLKRIKPMLKILGGFIQKQMKGQEKKLTLSNAEASLLFEMEKAKEMVGIRWHDEKKFRELGKQLSDFKEIENVQPSKDFKATLRDYQLFGLSWLQFLRKFHFGGVLADEMGLGKTIQTLAHINLEKDEQRMTGPCLIVAPTSLMGNWALECERFSPNLRFLVHHGDKRDKDVELSNYDIVFTTYALIARDKSLFLETEFYYLILDEAQNIKNEATKTAQILLQFQAKNRLCLTGTPIENHLGELWSLFNFLMPGYLHDKNTFNREYRLSIEKDNDDAKQALLRQKIKPFLLRRVKKEVALELPEKTESTIFVELTGAQREIYESIRLSMQEKVRQALMLNGLSRSHIVILDALLRLRQTCCSPKLLKMSEAENANSEKVEALFELLPILIEEGRKILLFSQFTSMIDLLEKEMEKRDFSYVTLTGKTRNRVEVIDKFRNTQVPVFLISLKAGGTGLNLTEADTVIHFDPWWNPQVENQATDRSHRIGQTKPVFVYKLICKDTVEEVMLSMQAKKSALVDNLLSLNKGSSSSLSVEDVNALFDLE